MLQMADSLYLNLWFPNFSEAEMFSRLLCVLKQFPFSADRPGIGYVGVHSVGWDEPLVFQESFDFRAQPEHAIQLASQFLHADSAYVFETVWDLWTPDESNYDQWVLKPQPVKFIVHGTEFDNAGFQEHGHIQVDFGLDTPFLYEDMELTALGEERVKQNVQKLVNFTQALEKACGITGRILWSESEENLAQKLVSRLQRVQ
jgi:hypothetical protein